jgi:hypothetical protein
MNTMHSLRRNLSLLALAACFAGPAAAQLGALGGLVGGGKSAGGGDIDADVGNFLKSSMRIESTINKAALAIVAAYQNETDRAASQAAFDQISKTTDPKEAGAKFQSVSESTAAEMKKLSASSDLADRTKNLSAEKQQQVAKGVANFLLGVLQSKDLVSSGQSMLSKASSNPMNLTKILPVKDALPRLGNAASLAGSTIPKFIDVLKGANVQVKEATTSSQEQDMSGGLK